MFPQYGESFPNQNFEGNNLLGFNEGIPFSNEMLFQFSPNIHHQNIVQSPFRFNLQTTTNSMATHNLSPLLATKNVIKKLGSEKTLNNYVENEEEILKLFKKKLYISIENPFYSSKFSYGSIIHKCGNGECITCEPHLTNRNLIVHKFYKFNEMKISQLRKNISILFEKVKSRSNLYSNMPMIHWIKEDDFSIDIYYDDFKLKNLFDNLEKENFNEMEISQIASQLIQQISFIYKNKIPSPKINFQNIYYSKEKDQIKILIFDNFHFLLEGNNVFYTNRFSDIIFYSPNYVKKHLRNIHTDLWAIGIILIVLLSGELPFRLFPYEKHMEFIKKLKLPTFKNEQLFFLPREFIDFICNLFNYSLAEKENLDLLTDHTWLQIKNNSIDPNGHIKERIEGLKKLKFVIYFQEAIFNYIEYNFLLKQKIKRLKKIVNNPMQHNFESNFIDSETLMNAFDLNDNEVNMIFNDYSLNKDYDLVFFKLIEKDLSFFHQILPSSFMNLPFIKDGLVSIKMLNSIFNMPHNNSKIDLISRKLNDLMKNEIRYNELFNILFYYFRAKFSNLN